MTCSQEEVTLPHFGGRFLGLAALPPSRSKGGLDTAEQEPTRGKSKHQYLKSVVPSGAPHSCSVP